jgi:hypothetical protein
MSIRPRRILLGLSTLVVLTSFTPARVPAATDPCGDGPVAVWWPVQRRGDPDMPEGTDPQVRNVLQDADLGCEASSPVGRPSFWQALARRFGLALGL